MYDVTKKIELLFTFANSFLFDLSVLRRIQLLQLEISRRLILQVTSSDGHDHDGEPNEVDVACGFNTEHVVITTLRALPVTRGLSKMYVEQLLSR